MWLFYVLPLVALFGMFIMHAKGSLKKLRAHWPEYRCNPMYMPFAGIIRPDIGVEKNFVHCLNKNGSDILAYPMDVIGQQLGLTGSNITSILAPLGNFMTLFSGLRGFMLSLGSSTFSKMATSTNAFVYYLIKIRDIIGRFVGQGYITGYLTYVIFNFAEGFIMLFITILKAFVIAMLAISFALALFQPEVLVMVLVFASFLAAAGA